MFFGLFVGPFNALLGHSPHFLQGVSFIPLELITPAAYLGSWAFVTPITSAKFS